MTEKDNFTLDNPIMFDKKNGRCRCIPIPYEKDMTEKRFKQVVNGVKDTRTGRTLTSPLEFTLKLNEINDLYDCVFDRNEELENENEQLKQQLTDVDRLIDCKIAEYQKYDGYDTEKYYIGTQLLKELKKEFER